MAFGSVMPSFVMLDDAGFAQALGNVLWWFVTLEGIDQLQANQVIETHFDG